ncbi:MAG: tetratricopeptide repeat protein [Planctomycetaceae bacterium]
MPEEPQLERLIAQGRAQLKEGQLEAARSLFQQARDLDDLEPDVHDGLATIAYLQGELELAAEHFERLTRLDPRRAPAWTNLGAIYNRLNNHTRAAEVLRRAVQVDRSSGAAFYNLGSAYRHLKQWSNAVPAYREAVRLEPTEPDAYIMLGQVYLEMKNVPQATAQFRKALELRPESKRARKGLDECEAAVTTETSKASPFGRLVNTEMLAQGQRATVASNRVLSTTERLRDRRAVDNLSAALEAEGAAVNQSLAEALSLSLVRLGKGLMLSNKPDRDAALTQGAEEYGRACRELGQLTTALRRTVRQLRDHEGTVQ